MPPRHAARFATTRRIALIAAACLPLLWTWSAMAGQLGDGFIAAILIGAALIVLLSLWSPGEGRRAS